MIYFSEEKIKELKNTIVKHEKNNHIPKEIMQTVKNKNVPERLS